MKRVLVPIAILGAGLPVAILLIATGPQLAPRPPEAFAPLVRTIRVEPATVRLTSVTHGTVAPRTESELIPEVAGRVLSVSPNLVSGGFFHQGDVLFRIDPLDYEVALEQARAGLARAQSELDNARRAHSRQQDLAQRQSTSESQRDDAQTRLNVAQAALREAEARLAKAARDLERTQFLAPYDGRVRAERVDPGQFVSRGASVGDIYATDFAEVRLPLPDDELAFLDLPLGGAVHDVAEFPRVVLRAQFAGRTHEWEGQVVRTEGELDPQTRMIHVVARVEAPYRETAARPPLAVGLFVEAEIEGRLAHDIVVLPRAALRGANSVYLVNAASELEYRDVDVLRVADEFVYVDRGLAAGDSVCVSALDTALPGMKVRAVADQAVSTR